MKEMKCSGITRRSVATLALVVLCDVLIHLLPEDAAINKIQDRLTQSVAPAVSSPPEFLSSLDTEDKIIFYLYPFEEFPSFWGAKSACDHSRSPNVKHDHADFAWQAMMQHPWRTTDPKESQLAILPLSLDLWAREVCGNDLSMDQVKNEVKRALQASPIFPSVRHLIIANDFGTKHIASAILQLLSPAGIGAMMEGRGDCRTSLGYTSNYAEFMSIRSPNHTEMPNPRRFGSERIYTIHMVGQVDNRPDYTDRKVLFESTGYIPSPYILTTYHQGNSLHQTLRHCNSTNTTGDFDRCLVDRRATRIETTYAQERSNFTLCLRGDTLGSDRWINAMTAGTALIQVADDEESALSWLPFPDAVPWKDIVITIPRKSYREDPAKAIRQVLETISEQRLLELQRLSLHFAADLDWQAHHSRVLENLIREAYNVPCVAFSNSTHHGGGLVERQEEVNL